MTLTHWQTLGAGGVASRRGANTWEDELNRLFDAVGTSWNANWRPSLNARWLPAVDLYEKNDLVTVRAEIPDTKKEDINISLQDGYLVLSGERKETRNDAGPGASRSERRQGRFERTVRLPYPVDGSAVKAAYTDGILTVELPKAEAAKPKKIKIDFN